MGLCMLSLDPSHALVVSCSLPQLARLSLNFCSLVTDMGLRGVAAGCGLRLTELRLDEAPRITDDGLLALSEACLNLQVIHSQPRAALPPPPPFYMVRALRSRFSAVVLAFQPCQLHPVSRVGTPCYWPVKRGFQHYLSRCRGPCHATAAVATPSLRHSPVQHLTLDCR